MLKAIRRERLCICEDVLRATLAHTAEVTCTTVAFEQCIGTADADIFRVTVDISDPWMHHFIYSLCQSM